MTDFMNYSPEFAQVDIEFSSLAIYRQWESTGNTLLGVSPKQIRVVLTHVRLTNHCLELRSHCLELKLVWENNRYTANHEAPLHGFIRWENVN